MQGTKRKDAEKPRSPERPPTKRQRRHFEESTGSKAEEKVAEAEVSFDPSAIAGLSVPKEFREYAEKKRKENEETVRRTASAKVKPKRRMVSRVGLQPSPRRRDPRMRTRSSFIRSYYTHQGGGGIGQGLGSPHTHGH